MLQTMKRFVSCHLLSFWKAGTSLPLEVQAGRLKPVRRHKFFLSLLALVLIFQFSAYLSAQEEGPFEQPEIAVPDWIWLDAERKGNQKVLFQKTFQCPIDITSARLHLASDFSSCRVVMNGRTVASLANFGPLLDLDIEDHLLQGKNTIELHASSSQGPAAVALSLKISSDGDSTIWVQTDSSWRTRVEEASASENHWSDAVSFGAVARQFWTDSRRSRIDAFDDYTQWKLASENGVVAGSADVIMQPGFQAELLRKAKSDEGSWVSMAFDLEGRITIAREDQGLLRLALPHQEKPESVELINETLMECRGLLYAYGDLYANANNSKGLYRLHDSNGDDQFDEVQLLREFPGGVGHGRNDLALGPDGMIYSIHGDSVNLPQSDIRDRTSPFRDGRLDSPQIQGHLVRTDRHGRNWELVSTGLRNPFGIDFNNDGELFTYDADAEYDMGAPWYRPTRVDHLVSGADFGWRGLTRDWPPYELDHADNALPSGVIGKGSPTAVKFGTKSNFPPPWQDAFYVLDWAYGRIVACHLYPRGAGYVCRHETFLEGRPLNVTDLEFGPDGAMYFITGGRKTESALYRISWKGEQTKKRQPTSQQQARKEFSAQQRKLRHHLEQWHHRSESNEVIDKIWPYLSSPDPSIRQAARVALEHQSIEQWRKRALEETHPATAAVALLALARGCKPSDEEEFLAALNALPEQKLSDYDKLSVLQAYSLCLLATSDLNAELFKLVQQRLLSWLARETAIRTLRSNPSGAGLNVSATLCRLVMQINGDVAHRDVVKHFRQATVQEDRILYLFLLRHATSGWEFSDRLLFFETLGELDRTVVRGEGMQGFLKRIREEAVNTLSQTERTKLGQLLQPQIEAEPTDATITRPHVRDWKIDDIDELLDVANQPEKNTELGRKLFTEVLCSRCHRMGYRGGLIGPDLTSVGRRFSRRDLLKSILEPSDVVAEKYRSIQVVTKSGRTMIGRVVPGGDFRSPTLKISIDSLDPSKSVELLRNEVEAHRQVKTSPMPKGLLATMTAEEITDLIDYLLNPSTSSDTETK